MTAFRAAVPWRSTLHAFNQRCSHDPARFRTVAGSREAQLAAAALLFTAPGIRVVSAGDEVDLEGHDNEDARRPCRGTGRGETSRRSRRTGR